MSSYFRNLIKSSEIVCDQRTDPVAPGKREAAFEQGPETLPEPIHFEETVNPDAKRSTQPRHREFGEGGFFDKSLIDASKAIEKKHQGRKAFHKTSPEKDVFQDELKKDEASAETEHVKPPTVSKNERVDDDVKDPGGPPCGDVENIKQAADLGYSAKRAAKPKRAFSVPHQKEDNHVADSLKENIREEQDPEEVSKQAATWGQVFGEVTNWASETPDKELSMSVLPKEVDKKTPAKEIPYIPEHGESVINPVQQIPSDQTASDNAGIRDLVLSIGTLSVVVENEQEKVPQTIPVRPGKPEDSKKGIRSARLARHYLRV